MFNLRVKKLMDEYGVMQEFIIKVIGSNRVSFGKKMKDNSFAIWEKIAILKKYGAIM